MALLIAIIVSGLFFALFIALTLVEAHTGKRVLSSVRERFDRDVVRVKGIVRRADFGALMFHGARVSLEYAIHMGVHGILSLVRAAERLLTRVARYLRSREEVLTTSRSFVSSWLSRAKRRVASKQEESHNQDTKPE